MSRVEENEQVRAQINRALNDQETVNEIFFDPNKGTQFLISTCIPLLHDMSLSLAVIADKISEVQQDEN